MNRSCRGVLVLGALWLLAAVAAPGASADVHRFCVSAVDANSRCIDGHYHWLYGVGVYSIMPVPPYMCVGAKTRSDGTGGDAVPFRCDYVPEGGTIWTPGGNSNYGWATVINRTPNIVLSTSYVNFRP